MDINSPLYEDVYYASLTGKDESKLNEKELELINKDCKKLLTTNLII